MNPAALQKLVADAITDNVFLNWRFYVALVCVGILSTVCTALLEGWGKKKGEIAATKADFQEVVRQLKETTIAAKSVELALAHNDWIQRELTTLKRTKLEQLLAAAFGIAAWTAEDATNIVNGKSSDDKGPIDEFLMLAVLYFPELQAETSKIEYCYRETLLKGGTTRLEILRQTQEIDKLTQPVQMELRKATIASRERLQLREKDPVVERSVAVYRAVHELAEAAHRLMQQLTNRPIA
jgi:hypothetical protein